MSQITMWFDDRKYAMYLEKIRQKNKSWLAKCYFCDKPSIKYDCQDHLIKPVCKKHFIH